MRFAITRDGQKYKRQGEAEVVNEHIKPRSGLRFIIADARDFTITAVQNPGRKLPHNGKYQDCPVLRYEQKSRRKKEQAEFQDADGIWTKAQAHKQECQRFRHV